jgi:DNA ligase-1
VWLDPAECKEFAFVSHAHSDHMARHRRIVCTRATARLAAVRAGISGTVFEPLEYGEVREFGGWSATLVPAGHVLGSAQVHIRTDEGSLLYTGDFKRREGLSCERVATVAADTLVIETTYGLPHYVFPPVAESLAAMVKFCHEALEDGEVPVLLGYSLGKAQEILMALSGEGLPVMVHGAIAKVAAVYQEFGVVFPAMRDWDPAAAGGCVMLAPPGAAGRRALASVARRRVAALTGWAMDPGAARRMQVDAAFPLSDHADYAELLAHVEEIGPKRVLTLHGFAREFAQDLRARGMEAWALTGPDQLEWDLLPPPSVRRRLPALPPLGERGFDALVGVCEGIRRATGTRRKVAMLAEYFRKLDPRGLRSAAVWFTGTPFPSCEQRQTHVGAAVVRKALALASGLPEGEIRAVSRLHNDSGDTVAELLARKEGLRLSRSLGEVAGCFEALSVARAPVAKVECLARVFRDSHPLVAATITRILHGDLRIGLKEGLVEEAIAEAFDADLSEVREAHMLTGDAGSVAALAASRRLGDLELLLFRPAKCMLASPEPDAASIWRRLGGEGMVWTEAKMDGIRAQAHFAPGKAELYSRDLRKVSESFPELCLPLAAAGFSAILDGEIVAWEGERPQAFARLQRRLGRRADDLFLPRSVGVAYFVFDVLAVDGESLLRLPLAGRRAALEGLQLPPVCRLAPVRHATSVVDLAAFFRENREQGHEGLMAKDPASVYAPGRRGHAWLKLKEALGTLDVVVVVAAEFGHGRRRAVLSDLTFAVRDGGRLAIVGKAYTGLTDHEIEELTAEFLSGALSRRGNRVEVEPRVVIEVAFDAIQASGRHASGLAMRFPRIVRIRRDLGPGDISTLEQARALVDKGVVSY